MSDINKAPVDLYIKMHGALVDKDYKIALNYCNAILSYEQKNVMMGTFHELLMKKLEIMDEETDNSDTISSSDSDVDTDT